LLDDMFGSVNVEWRRRAEGFGGYFLGF
jgi:hypothetical protein